MKALRFNSTNKTFLLENVPVPKIVKPTDVIIKIAYGGVCGTDLHMIDGEFPCSKETVTMGHEFCGVITQIGDEVSGFKVGDRIAVNPNDCCDCCKFCHNGNPNYCPKGGIRNGIGKFRNGGWAEYCLVPVREIHKIPDSLTLEQAALTEPISCIIHGWDMVNPIYIGQKILIQGAGIIGSLWAAVLHLHGHKNVTVSEPNATRLNILKNLDLGYDLITPDQLKERHDSNSCYVFDVIIDCSGYAPAIEYSVDLLEKGGKLCCFGVTSPRAEIKLKPFEIFMRELSIFGVLQNPYCLDKAIGLIESLGNRYLNYDNLGIKTFDLEEYKEAIEMLKNGLIAKAMFKL